MNSSIGEATQGCDKKNANTEVECSNCSMHNLCQLAGLDSVNPDVLDSIVNRKKELANGEVLFDVGDKFKGVFAVKRGMFKTVTYFEDREQIIDFYLPGELIGLDAINSSTYLHKVVAMEGSSICEMDLEAMKKLDDKFVDFQASIIQALGRKVRMDQYLAVLISAQSAEQRLAVFLIGLSSRFQAHGLPSEEFRLSILRKDIANYLGLALETISRMFKAFEQQGLISTRGRRVELVKLEELRKLARIA
jgi:CRP/FNR family transcriptional regulator, anaerobic regulatory protein